MSLALSTFPAALLRCATPSLTSCRHRNKLNIQRPRLPHWEKLKLQVITKPRYPTLPQVYQHVNACHNVFKLKTEHKDHPLEIIYARKLKAICDESRVFLLYHRNSMDLNEIHKAWQISKRLGYTYHKTFTNTIARIAFTDTRLSNLLSLCVSYTSLVTSSRDEKLSTLLTTLRKRTQLVLLGGIIEHRFLSANQLIEYSQLGGLDAARAVTSSLLASPASSISSSITSHQRELVRLLSSHAESMKDE